MRPVIGITAKLSLDDSIGLSTDLGCRNQSWLLLADDYIKSVEQMGGAPVVIPIMGNYENAFGIVSKLDGIIFSGGNDVNPKYYDERAEFEYTDLIESLDELEINLYRKVWRETRMPILGICRGLQLMNTVHGGKLYQEMRMGEYPKHTYYKEPIPKNAMIHEVSLKENSLLRTIVGEPVIHTNSFHHQSIRVLGEGLTVNAVSEDGIVEGIEGETGRFLMAVQWHPEMLAPEDSLCDGPSRRIFQHFIQEAAAFQAEQK